MVDVKFFLFKLYIEMFFYSGLFSDVLNLGTTTMLILSVFQN